MLHADLALGVEKKRARAGCRICRLYSYEYEMAFWSYFYNPSLDVSVLDIVENTGIHDWDLRPNVN
jgi:hypothetical protein